MCHFFHAQSHDRTRIYARIYTLIIECVTSFMLTCTGVNDHTRSYRLDINCVISVVFSYTDMHKHMQRYTIMHADHRLCHLCRSQFPQIRNLCHLPRLPSQILRQLQQVRQLTQNCDEPDAVLVHVYRNVCFYVCANMCAFVHAKINCDIKCLVM